MSTPILHLKFKERDKIQGQYYVDESKFFLGNDLRANHFCLKDELPKRYQLFEKVGQNYVVNLPAKVSGEIVKEGSKVDLQSLKALGFIQQKNGNIKLPIERGQFGVFHWDELTIDFDYRYSVKDFKKEIAALALADRQFQARYESQLKKVQRIFGIALLLSLLIHWSFGLYTFLKELPPLEIQTIEQVSKRFARLILEPPPKIKTPEKEVTTQQTGPVATTKKSPKPKKKQGKSDTKKKAAKKKKGAAGGGDGKKAGGKLDGKKDVTAMGVLGVITAQDGADDNTAVSNLEAFGIAQKMESAFGKSDQGGGGGEGTGWGEGKGFPFLNSYGDGLYGDVVGEEVIEETVSSVSLKRAGDITFDDPSKVAGEGADSAFRSASAIRKAIMSQMEGIRFCFNQSLKQQSNISGKIVVEFTIMAKGSVQSPIIISTNLGAPDLEACVLEVVKRWRFQPISAGDVIVNYPLVFTPNG